MLKYSVNPQICPNIIWLILTNYRTAIPILAALLKRMNKLYMNKAILSLCVALLFLVGCSDTDNCESGSIETLCLEDLGCTNAVRLVKLNSTKELELIKNQEEFDQLVVAPCDLVIDWQKYDLIIGTVRLNQGFIGMKKTAVFDCVQNQIEMTIEIFLSNSADAPTVTWSFLVPKSSDFFIRPLIFD